MKWARRRAGLTQSELASALGMPQSTIARIERGTTMPRTSTFLAILEATGVELVLEPATPAEDGHEEAVRRQLVEPEPTRARLAFGRVGSNIRTSPMRMLRRLRLYGVPFVLIGDVAEAVHGSPSRLERAVQVCLERTPIALERLARALEDLEASPEAAVELDAMAGRGAALERETPVGRLRLVTANEAGDDYDVLRRNARNTLVDTSLLIRVASLDDLIRARRARGRPEDVRAIAILRTIGAAESSPSSPHTP